MPQTFSNRMRLWWRGKRNELQQADCYFRGEFVARDPDLAEELYREALRKNLPGTQFKLGLFYHGQRGREHLAAEAYFNAFLEGDLRAKSALEMLADLPQNFVSHFYLAQLLERKNDWNLAREHYQIAAEGGHVLAMYHLGELHQEGRFHNEISLIPQDLRQALTWYKNAAQAGYEPALQKLSASREPLAFLYLAQVQETQGKNSDALRNYRQAFQSNDKEATFRLGEIYERGELGVQQNLSESLNFYLRSRQLGSSEASLVLERLVMSPFYQTSREQFVSLATNSADFAFLAGQKFFQAESFSEAFFFYATAMKKNHAEAEEILVSEASLGNVEAAYALGVHYCHSKGDFVEAIDWCLIAADHHEGAFNYLKTMVFPPELYLKIAIQYEQGEENPKQNFDLACMFYKKAAMAESPEAIEWFVFAAEENHSSAIEFLTTTEFSLEVILALAKRYEEGLGVKVNIEQAMQFYSKALSRGNCLSAFKLGLFHELKGDTDESLRQACQYYFEAVRRGYRGALEACERLAEFASPEIRTQLALLYQQVDPLKAAEWGMLKESGPVILKPTLSSFLLKPKEDAGKRYARLEKIYQMS